MPKLLVQIVADNLAAALEASQFESYRELARAAGVSPNTVKNLVKPETRAPNKRGETSPRIDVVEKLARAFGYSVWALMVEGFEPSQPYTRAITQREADFHRSIEDAYRKLNPPKPDSPPSE